MKRHYEDASDDVTQGRLLQAAQQVMKTKEITPLLKEELRLSILIRRHAQGEEQIKAEFKDPEYHELTPDEEEKKMRRREQNRRAAQRCRMKKKKKHDGWIETFSKILEQNQKLVQEIETLRQQKKELNEILQQHMTSGKCWYSQECPHTQTRDSVHQSTQSFCEAMQRSVPGASELWSENSPAFPCRTSTSSGLSTDSEDIHNMLNLSDMDFPSHPQMDELLYLDITADTRRQGLSTSSMSSDGEGLAGYGVVEAALCDPLQDDDDVFQTGGGPQVQLEDIQPDMLSVGQYNTELTQHQNTATCEKLINDEKCFYSEP
ncbi:transcription factor kayak-like [Gigantopelta aegis]|uniref:transcription factor kayak-like n=1 Tax=Gigantopelta aegis TaxID=1735272 RepID=UPI001B887999|nr:transcription factor kayak-like [Gigantopelta aegis]